MTHRKARLAVHRGGLLIDRVRSGRPVAHAATEIGAPRPRTHKWSRRWGFRGRKRTLRPLPPPLDTYLAQIAEEKQTSLFFGISASRKAQPPSHDQHR
ncbi:leucine zipper domain-containing protein [Streptomyces sp. R11]|uniref:Leucine zipper domain-containing protein n=1 Tax=Streptomyces sp. R11 TaxID=3238625 RepID=A0AB39NFY5_9ACTN